MNIKKLHQLIIAFVAVTLSVSADAKAKYVFYFIGDGMGVNQVNAAETYLASVEGRIGIKELCFPSFPYAGLVNTQSGTNGVTDSAAGGTALATGEKSHNGSLGVLTDQTTPVTSIAQWAKDAGAAVGVTTSVTVDHATPGAFYAHVASRTEYYKIGTQLVASGYDFFAGSDFTSPKNPSASAGSDSANDGDLYQQAEKAGYTIAKGYGDYQAKATSADKMILLQSDAANKTYHLSIPYAIDRSEGDLSLPDITRAAIDFLMSKQSERDGFFLMVEGGKIDWACHPNETATFIHELIDMDEAVRVAFEFYQQHPDETLIVITADHETGGFVMGTGKYELHLERLQYTRMSIEKLGNELHRMRDTYGEGYTIDIVKDFLAENFGFWREVELSDEQTARIEQAFNNIMEGKGETTETLYQKDDELASAVKNTLNEVAHISWASGGHSNGYVPVFAIGTGAEQFTGRMDNTEIPKRMAKAAEWGGSCK